MNPPRREKSVFIHPLQRTEAADSWRSDGLNSLTSATLLDFRTEVAGVSDQSPAQGLAVDTASRSRISLDVSTEQ